MTAITTELRELDERKAHLLNLINLREEVSKLEEAWVFSQGKKAIGTIAILVCDHFRVTLAAILAKSRPESIVIPRQVIFHLCRKLTDASLHQIGKVLRRDHGTIIHGCLATKNRMETDKKFRELVTQLEAKCKAKLDQQVNGEKATLGHKA